MARSTWSTPSANYAVEWNGNNLNFMDSDGSSILTVSDAPGFAKAILEQADDFPSWRQPVSKWKRLGDALSASANNAGATIAAGDETYVGIKVTNGGASFGTGEVESFCKMILSLAGERAALGEAMRA